MNDVQVCTRCVMDTTMQDTWFDAQGVCNHCKRYDEQMASSPNHDGHGQERLAVIVDQIKASGKGKKYDCLIGVSGGVDSTYIAYQIKNLGLRPLAVHLDNGWNSELAVSNIEKTLKKLDIDLYTHVIPWEEFKDLQKSFLRASVPHCEHPTDHAILGLLYSIAAREGIGYIISGHNIATEGISFRAGGRGQRDWLYIKNIHERFGTRKLTGYPHFTLWDSVRYKLFNRQKTVRILNYLPYNKEEAMKILENELGWKYYGGKHYESIYTRFFQGYILPIKFNVDKRKAHLSSLICGGQTTREQALAELAQPPYPPETQEEDRLFVIKKLGLSEEEFAGIMALPCKRFSDYPSYDTTFWYKYAVDMYARFKSVLGLSPETVK